jgi:SAM-dependent methyltransferase
MRATDLAHLLVRQCVQPGDWVVDATVGNGHDTMMLAEAVGPAGRVFGFDVQAGALETAAARLPGLPQLTLIHSGHELLTAHLPAGVKGRLAAVMFNLGYLPGGPKDVVTRSATTLPALEQAMALLRRGGRITVVVYPGHRGGAGEAGDVRAFVAALPGAFMSSVFTRINALQTAPELLVIERLK